MLLSGPAFPTTKPTGYTELKEDVVFDPKQHLDLQFPERIWSLEEFGYSEEDILSAASPVAVTSPFKLLSTEGVKTLHYIATKLQTVCTHLEGERVPKHLAGGVYRSKFLRDLCASPDILEHISSISQTELIPHSMPSQQVYINYSPDDISKAVDAWHYDGIGFDYVLMVSDPTSFKGGNFEYFKGTREEVADLFGLQVHQVRYGIHQDFPQDRVIKAKFPEAGYAIFQQGDRVVHRAARLLEPAERITVVPGFVSRKYKMVDPTAKSDMTKYNEPGIIPEIARHSAWLAAEKLNDLIQDLDMSSDREQVEIALRDSISDINETLQLFNPK